MADKLEDILKGRGGTKPPAEIKLIKNFVMERFKSDVSVQIKDKQITIVTDSSALAGALRMQLHELQAQLKTQKRLVIRIG